MNKKTIVYLYLQDSYLLIRQEFISITAPPVTSKAQLIPTSLTSDEQSMVDMVNQARTDADIKHLNVDFRLVRQCIW